MFDSLELAFAEMDADVLAKQTAWALERKRVILEYQNTAEAKEFSKNDLWGYYNYLFSLAGGKTWYNVLSRSGDAAIRAFVAKNCKALAIKRNHTIIKKLNKLGIVTAWNLTFSRTDDGYRGIFTFDNFRVKIDTIIAGGYNVQCLHYRTLVYVNEKKI